MADRVGSGGLAGPGTTGSAGAAGGGGPIWTPVGWRIAAAIILSGGVAGGIIGSASGFDSWIVIAFVVALAIGVIPIMLGSRRPPISAEALDSAGGGSGGHLPTVLVLIAGRDEAIVLPNLIADLAAQDHRNPDGSPRFSVTVVDDRSTDGTGAATIAAAQASGLGTAVRVLRREGIGLADGKGAAAASARAEDSEEDVVVVLDADARIGPTYLRRAAQYVAAGVPAVAARRRILHADTSILARIQADEQDQDGELQGGRHGSGGCSEFRGNGIVIRRDLLGVVGGVPSDSLTEDLELSSRVAAIAGITVAWAFDLEVWEEPVPTWHGLWRQRLRWSEGGFRRLFRLGPSVLRSSRLSLRARWDFAAYGAQLVAPPLIAGALVGAVVLQRPLLAAGLTLSYLAAGGVLAFDSLRWESNASGTTLGVGERLARTVPVALFSLVWLAALNGALVRLITRGGPVRYDKTDRAADLPREIRPASAGRATARPATAGPQPVTPAPAKAADDELVAQDAMNVTGSGRP